MKIKFKAINSCRDTRRAQVYLTDGETVIRLDCEVSADLLAHEVSILSADAPVNETSEPFMRLADATEWLEARLDEVAAELGMVETTVRALHGAEKAAALREIAGTAATPVFTYR